MSPPAIHAPFARIHLVLLIATALVVITVFALVGLVLTIPIDPEQRGDKMLGTGVTAVIGVIALVTYWAAYLGNQRSADVREGSIHFRSWIRLGSIGTDRVIDLKTVDHALLLRPHHIEFSIPGAETRVGTFYQTLRDKDRVGTFWWREEDYRRLQAALEQQGVPTEYQHVPGPGTLLSSM